MICRENGVEERKTHKTWMVLAEEIEKEDSIFVLDFKRRNQSQKEGIFHGEYTADCGQSGIGNFQNNAEDRIGERRKSSQSACSGIQMQHNNH